MPVFGTLPDQPAVGVGRSQNMRAPSAHVPKLDSNRKCTHLLRENAAIGQQTNVLLSDTEAM